MTKNYLCIMMLAALALFASCSDSKTSPEAIEGYEFTGDGIFENLPYAFARFDYDYQKLSDKLASKGIRIMQEEEGKKYGYEFINENKPIIEKLAKKLDGKEIPFERHVGGKKEKIKGFKLKLKNEKVIGTWCYLFDIVRPEDYTLGKSERRSTNRILAVDKDGKALNLQGVSWLRYGVKIGKYSFRLDISSHMKEMLSTKLYYDQVAKLVEVDDEALEVFAKEKQEADGKKMEEAAKNNDLSKADFTEKGCGPITLGKKVKSLPDNYENLYTSYKWKVDQGVNAKVYTFYNGSEEVATLYANIKNGEIFRIFVKSDKITIKFDGGKTLKPGMKLRDAVKAFGEECQASSTPEEGIPMIHFGIYGRYPVYDETMTSVGNERLNEIIDSFDMLPMQPDFVSSNEVMETITLSLYDLP